MFRRAIPTSQQRRLLQVSLDWCRPKDPPLSLGHASILANLSANNIPFDQLSLAVNKADFDVSSVVEWVMAKTSNEVVPSTTDFAIGAFVWNDVYAIEIMKKLRLRDFRGRIIVGGPQVSYVSYPVLS